MALGKLWDYVKKYDKPRKQSDREDAVEVEKGDETAMILAACLVFIPAALLILAVVVGIPMLFFLR